MTNQVFLGGSCNPTTWRRDTAIPALEKAGVTFFNPQVENWSKELVAAEAAAKESCKTLLWVIDGETRSVASMNEAVEWAIRNPDKLYLVIVDVPQYSTINGVWVDPDQVKDLNRGRSYLRDIAERHNVPVFDSVEDAVKTVIAVVNTPSR
jgi:hypothetical protein